MKYEYKGVIYTIVAYVELKHPVTREWLMGVLYQNEEGTWFVREETEFNERFKKL